MSTRRQWRGRLRREAEEVAHLVIVVAMGYVEVFRVIGIIVVRAVVPV